MTFAASPVFKRGYKLKSLEFLIHSWKPLQRNKPGGFGEGEVSGGWDSGAMGIGQAIALRPRGSWHTAIDYSGEGRVPGRIRTVLCNIPTSAFLDNGA